MKNILHRLRAFSPLDLSKIPKKKNSSWGASIEPFSISFILKGDKDDDNLSGVPSLSLSPPPVAHSHFCAPALFRTQMQRPRQAGPRGPTPRPCGSGKGREGGREGVRGGEALSSAVALFLQWRERHSRLYKSRRSDGSKHQSLFSARRRTTATSI